MQQYLLSVYQPDGPAARRRTWTRSCATSTRCSDELGRRRVGVRRRPAPAEHRHRGAARTARC